MSSRDIGDDLRQSRPYPDITLESVSTEGATPMSEVAPKPGESLRSITEQKAMTFALFIFI